MLQKKISLLGIKTEAEFHELVSVALGFPDYYGRNLDAFDECLADCCEGCEVRVSGLDMLNGELRKKILRYIDIMRDFESETNWRFVVTVI